LVLVLGLIRYLAIRNDAINGDISYSRLMKAKLITSYCIGIYYTVPIFLAFTVEDFWLRDRSGYSFLYLIFSVAWIWLAILMKLEQDRNLTQVWYCHQFFWVTNCFWVTVFSVVLFANNIYHKDIVAHAFASGEVLLSLLVVGFMLKTKSMRLRRLEDRYGRDTKLDVNKEKLLPKTYLREINVTLEYKITKKNQVFFKIIAGKVNSRIKRNLEDFYQIEEYLINFIDWKMPELRNILPSLEKSEAAWKKGLNNTSVYESRLLSIDNFLQALSETPQFWTRDILIFLGIDKGSEQVFYLQKRHELLQRNNHGLDQSNPPGDNNPFNLLHEDSSERSYR